jgi:lysozyme
VAEQSRSRRRGFRLVVLGALGVLMLVLATVAIGWWAWLPSYRPALAAGESYGVDVSSHQRSITWRRVRSNHIHFAYIKATEGADFVDPRFATNWSEAQRVGLRVGAYHFFTLCAPGAAQAQHFLTTVPDTPAALPAAIDLELVGNCHARPDPSALDQQVAEFVRLVEEHTHQPMTVYAGASFTHRYSLPSLREHPRWIRRLLIHPSARQWHIWQANDHAHVEGIRGHVDLDVMRTP